VSTYGPLMRLFERMPWSQRIYGDGWDSPSDPAWNGDRYDGVLLADSRHLSPGWQQAYRRGGCRLLPGGLS
jgi:hypothetical protein